MRRTRRITRALASLAIALAVLLAQPLGALACTQIYVGPGLTTTGDTFVGRSEDYNPRHAKAFGVQLPMENPTYTSEESDFEYTYEGTTLRYTYVRDTSADWGEGTVPYSEAGTNEKGVSISATLSTDYNAAIAEVDPLCNPDNPNGETAGIGEYSIPDVVLGQASTAREGVELLGSIIDEYGNNECNQILIADQNETWIFMQLSGHQWLAVRCDDNIASLNPNMGNLRFTVDLDDESVCLHSEGLVDTAKEAGTWDDANPDVAAAYGEADADSSPRCMTRYAQGMAYFGVPLAEGTDYTMGDEGVATLANPQLFFTPSGQVDLYTMMRSYAARGEQTENLNANTNENLYAIGNNRTVETHLFQIRHGEEYSADVATVQWEALSRAEFSVYIPLYPSLITKVDANYYPDFATFDVEHQGEDQSVDDVDVALEADEGQSLDYVFMDINTLAYNNRESCADGVSRYLAALQNELIAQQDEVDDYLLAADEADRTDIANTALQAASEETYAKADAMLGELRDYVSAGDFSEPFVPSDLNDDGTLKTPLKYAEKVENGTASEIATAEVEGTSEEPAAEEGSDTNALLPIIIVVVVIVIVVVIARGKKGSKPEDGASNEAPTEDSPEKGEDE
jgi:dipeptidase